MKRIVVMTLAQDKALATLVQMDRDLVCFVGLGQDRIGLLSLALLRAQDRIGFLSLADFGVSGQDRRLVCHCLSLPVDQVAPLRWVWRLALRVLVG